MRVLVLAPIDNSPFALAVAELCRREPGVEVTAIVVRRILDWKRLRGELRRDSVRLVRKAWRKLVLRGSVLIPPDLIHCNPRGGGAGSRVVSGRRLRRTTLGGPGGAP